MTRRWTSAGSSTTSGRPQGGSEMRSRFWMGGPYIALRKAPDSRPRRCVRLQRSHRRPEATARNLLVHCAQEMNHLAGFLPELYESFGNE